MAMTLQEIFDKVAAHLLTQKSKSTAKHPSKSDDGEICAYRGEGGKMCAVGCLIPDDNYNFGLERNVARSAVVMTALEKSGVLSLSPNGGMDGKRSQLLMELQQIHDGRATDDWKHCLWMLASRRGLEHTILDKF